ncbi:C40 family peptidase [Streptomyces montanisoli]|uniref:C40 family peptidase n=1 Tax=Streptomyces montanisoli TaxID=2798581 RepID=A0A940M4N1_9ACTN|nr:C40 family peptidase [Streptomyces montanisoli]MBP0456044.1 C40 family peptidase [Streptomyces montanisoli]
MATHRRPKPPGRARVTVLTTTAAAAVALTTHAAQANPSQESPRSPRTAKAKVDALFEQAEIATENYDGVKAKRQTLQKQVSDLQDQVAREQGDLNTSREQLGSLATAQYRSGGLDPTVQLLLSSSPGDYLEKASLLGRLSDHQAAALRQIAAQKRTLEQQRAEAAVKLDELNKTRKQLGKKKQEVQARLRAAQELYNSLSAAQKAKIKAGQARADRSNSRTDLGNAPPASSRAAAALAAAKSKIGTPYVWGATGPNSFDCSGLTSWAYAQAGVSIPRTSQAQAGAGTRLTRSQLKPGDLVLFYGDLHHIGLYAGNGMVLHAPRTGQNVKIEPVSDMPFEFGVRV